MNKFAFISRHTPTPKQKELCEKKNIELVHVGDRDAFTIDPSEFSEFAGAVVVHPAAALILKNAGLKVGIFERVGRTENGVPLEGLPPFAELHVF